MMKMRLKNLLAALLSLISLASATADCLATDAPYDGGGVLYYGEQGLPVAGTFADVQIYNHNGDTIQDFFGPAGKGFMPGDNRS